jgi:hypothetical protein
VGDRTCKAVSPGGPGLRAERILGAIVPCGIHYTHTMNTEEIVQAIDAEIIRLEQFALC